jgi:hypothetical protein
MIPSFEGKYKLIEKRKITLDDDVHPLSDSINSADGRFVLAYKSPSLSRNKPGRISTQHNWIVVDVLSENSFTIKRNSKNEEIYRVNDDNILLHDEESNSTRIINMRSRNERTIEWGNPFEGNYELEVIDTDRAIYTNRSPSSKKGVVVYPDSNKFKILTLNDTNNSRHVLRGISKKFLFMEDRERKELHIYSKEDVFREVFLKDLPVKETTIKALFERKETHIIQPIHVVTTPTGFMFLSYDYGSNSVGLIGDGQIIVINLEHLEE